MKYIERNECVINHTADLEPLYTFKKFPVFMGCTLKTETNDLKADMKWSISKSSGLIQLSSLLPLDILYPEAHGAGCVGGLWKSHHSAFANFILNYNINSIFEIGGSHGILAKECNDIKNIDWVILEPNPTPIKGTKARFIKGFFDNKFKYSDPFDAVVHSHLFEHIYEPDLFMKQLSSFIPENKYLFFSVPNMQIMLERKYTNCINFEHTIFLTEPYVDFLLARHGFRLLDKKYFLDDHSIFYVAVRDSSMKAFELPVNLYDKNNNLYLEYVNYHKGLISTLNEKMNSTKQNIYLFGAHVFAQYLIAFGLDASRIIFILDNDINKQEKRLYGTSLKVKSPKVLKDVENPVVILKAGVYNNEVRQDILNNINSGVVFWE